MVNLLAAILWREIDDLLESKKKRMLTEIHKTNCMWNFLIAHCIRYITSYLRKLYGKVNRNMIVAGHLKAREPRFFISNAWPQWIVINDAITKFLVAWRLKYQRNKLSSVVNIIINTVFTLYPDWFRPDWN